MASMMKKTMPISKLFACLTISLLLGSAILPTTCVEGRDTASDMWPATDGLGRALPDFRECGGPRPGKFVGIFYFLWMEPSGKTVYDISKILSANPVTPKWGPPGAFHWWSEPKLGYYRSDDPFVIRKHAQLLSDAGIDVVIFDVTNAFTYDATFLKICEVFMQIRGEGGRTPQIAFITHSNPSRVVKHLYDVLYAKNLYPELWFRWKNKPLILSDSEGLEAGIRDFFTFRTSWAWTRGQKWFGDGKDKWPWLDHTPQQPGWDDNPGKPEEICVEAAEHPISNIGRSFHAGHEPPIAEQHPEQGLYFAEQWKRALQVNPEFIFVTGWNEWIAQRFVSKKGAVSLAGHRLTEGDSYFIDTYSQEFSRDLEPMRGGHGDAFYYQLVANVRRFKGVRPPPASFIPKVISLKGDFHQWDQVAPSYLDDLFDTAHRDHPGYGDAGAYKNDTGHNDFDTMKVTYDLQNIYFYVKTREAITQPDGDNSMALLLDVDRNHKTGWEGYDFRVSREGPGAAFCTIKRYVDHGQWKPVGTARFVVAGNEMQLAVPRAVMGLDKDKVRFDFKWADNISFAGNALDFLDQGDVAPNGRFNYRYGE